MSLFLILCRLLQRRKNSFPLNGVFGWWKSFCPSGVLDRVFSPAHITIFFWRKRCFEMICDLCISMNFKKERRLNDA